MLKHTNTNLVVPRKNINMTISGGRFKTRKVPFNNNKKTAMSDEEEKESISNFIVFFHLLLLC